MSSTQHRLRDPLDPGARATEVARLALEDQQYEDAFRQLLERFLAHDPREAVTPALGVLAALANGVTLLSEAAALAEALPRAYRAGDSVYAYFIGLGERQRCAKLNEIGLVVRQLLGGTLFTPADAIKSFVDWLDQQGLAHFKLNQSGRAAQLAAIERGARAFWSRRLPNLLLSDSTAEITLRPLRPQALARWFTGHPLALALPTQPCVNVSAASMLESADAIEVGPVLQQIVDIMSAGDGTKLDALRGLQLQLLEPLLELVEGDILGSMLLTVVSGICERGTIETSRPSHSISSRYTRELARMLVAAPDLAASVLQLGPAARKSAYEALVQHANDPSDARAAWTTADMHLCDAMGLDPAVPFQRSSFNAPRGPARYLSPVERHRIRQLSPKLAPTTDLEVVVRAVVEMACAQPLRPGDIRDARLVDLEIYPGRAVLNLRRRRNLKGPKRRATEGPMEFTAPHVVAALGALKTHRELQAATDECPLWAHDISEARRRYARACGLIDQTCKLVSGDPFESFYSLRHGQFTEAIHEALLLDEPAKAQAALKRASQAGKHKHIETSVQNYFRLGAEHAHRHARAAIGSLLTRDGAALWSGLSRNALDMRVSRSDFAPTEVLWEAIEQAAPLDRFKDIVEEYPCAPPCFEVAKAAIRLADVLGSATLTQISFKEGVPLPRSTASLLSQTSEWERRLLAARSVYEAQWCEATGLPATRQPKLRSLATRLSRFADSAAVREATALWRRTARKGYIDVSDAPRLCAWIRFLVASGIPASRLVLRLDSSMKSKLEFLSSVFSSTTGLLPMIDEVPCGKGRPAVYFLIASKEARPGDVLPPAATSMSGFNGLMLAACLREDLSSNSSEA